MERRLKRALASNPHDVGTALHLAYDIRCYLGAKPRTFKRVEVQLGSAQRRLKEMEQGKDGMH